MEERKKGSKRGRKKERKKERKQPSDNDLLWQRNVSTVFASAALLL